MKTQCPNCKKNFKAPDEYEGRKVKCTQCKIIFEAHKIDIISEQARQKLDVLIKKTTEAKIKSKGLLSRLWTNSPIAFRNAFLSTFGVISALVIAYYFFDWLYLSKPSAKPEINSAEINPAYSWPILEPNYGWKTIDRDSYYCLIAWKFKVHTRHNQPVGGQVCFLDKDGFVIFRDYFSPVEIDGTDEISQTCLVTRTAALQIKSMRIMFTKL